MISRRSLVFGGAMSFAALASSRAMADPQPLGPLLNTPDFDRLAPEWRRVGLRPYRKGGVKLDIDPGADTVQARKVLIYNYGHGGAGITLAWGCADQVKDFVDTALRTRLQKPPKQTRVAVVGAGVIGLATAAELKRWAPDLTVTVMAENVDAAGNPMPQSTTSWIAGGQFEPSALWREYQDCDHPCKMDILHDLVRRSHRRIQQIKALGIQGDYGIADRTNYILANEDDEGFALGMPRDVVPAAQTGLLPFAKLATVAGKAYATWLINPTILLPRLVSDLRAASVRFEKRKLRTRAELIAIDADIIINCTGLGAAKILPGTGLTPIRGQLVVLQNTDKLDYLFSGGCGNKSAYMFCRQDDIVIGGTFDYTANLSGLTDKSYLTMRDRVKDIFSGNVSACNSTPSNGACHP
ncbi:hypothetical protein ABAC460_20635 [Asticcacaulis sp. AC460]|uniref:FAD-dependent oxidoreductase n=1 Tax=Asticcacaulis sp. AC460 TaxID=1282360 RepID=UPI0003C3DDB5|nr:FAD-dependent oxidoreductase [Asticcacaulis sp. AC460]ESQ87181.1 hypothetical protein ABAC460_20635 [Asticcacaulis sp. AC460]